MEEKIDEDLEDQASQINIENATDLGILPKPAQWPKTQFGTEVFP